MIPVRETGDDVLVEVGEHALERFRGARRRLREGAADVARLDVGEDGPLLDALPVVDGPFRRESERLAQGVPAPVRGFGGRAGRLAGGSGGGLAVRSIDGVRHASS